MYSNICYNCGFVFDALDGDRRCPVCGAIMMHGKPPEEEELLSSAFTFLRESRFDEAKVDFEAILLHDPESTEAYWGRLRARYHIDYAKMFSGQLLPKCPTRSGARISEDSDYLRAMEYADEEQKAFLQAQAEYIKTFCTPMGRSKNRVTHFTLGEIDPNEAFGVHTEAPSNEYAKLKKIIAFSAVLAVVLAIAVFLVLWLKNIPIYADNGLQLRLNKDGTYSVVGIGKCTDDEILISSSYENTPVTSIAASAFSYCSTLTSVEIQKGVTSIGEKAFESCHKLKKIVIPTGVTEIGSFAFSYCSVLESVDIPDGVRTIGASAFFHCVALTNITIPASVRSIANSAFYGCQSLTNALILNGVTNIGGDAFGSCNNLTSIVIPSSVKTIGSFAFSDCSSLTSIVIPDSVTRIGNSAFEGCRGLTSSVIPDSVTSIGKSAFFGCRGLTSIQFNGTTAQWKSISFGSGWDVNTDNHKIICTDGTIAKDGTVTYN